MAAYAARRWLARNAAAIKVFTCRFIYERTFTNIPTYMSLVSCLPALEKVKLRVPRPLVPEDLDCLLEALAWLPRLRALALSRAEAGVRSSSDNEASQPCPDTSAFAKLRSLTKLALTFGKADTYTVAGVVDALVSLTCLAKLKLSIPRSTVLPAALRQLKGLRCLKLSDLNLEAFQASCLELPNLLSLEFFDCQLCNAEVVPGVTALQNLTGIKLGHGQGPRLFDQQLVRLPRLQRLVFDECGGFLACPWQSRRPADMGSLSSTLLHLSCCRAMLTQLPLAFMQLAALEHLDVSETSIAELPSGITALSKLTELVLGRCYRREYLHDTRPLDVRALSDLSAFPALCRLSFHCCEVTLCETMLGAVRHASLASMAFVISHPAPECALTVLQLSQELRRLRRGSVLRFRYCEPPSGHRHAEYEFQSAHALPPLYKFQVALQAYGI